MVLQAVQGSDFEAIKATQDQSKQWLLKAKKSFKFDEKSSTETNKEIR